MEDWIAIKNYEGLYEISSKGKVRSLDREVEYKKGFSNKVFKKKLKSKEISIVVTEYDFIRCSQVTLFKDGEKKTLTLARLMLESFYPNEDSTDKIAMFRDGFTDHVVLDNVYWGTKSEQAIRSHENSFTKTSAYVGIHQGKNGLFIANSYINGKKYYVGTYATDNDAREAQRFFEDSFNGDDVKTINRRKMTVDNYSEPTDGYKAMRGIYYGLYECNPSDGSIRSSKSKRELSYGSYYVRLTDINGNAKRVMRKLIIAEMFVDNPLGHKHVVNIDGNAYNCSADNLRWSRTNKTVARESASGFIGVRHDQVHGCWSARYGEKFIGNFENEYDAYEARCRYIEDNCLD